MTVDLRLLAIVDPDVLRGGDLVLAARAAEAGGATALQLRMKRAGAGAMLAAARRLRDELVHVGADDLPVEALRLVAPRGFRIGVSVGTPAEAAAAGRAGPDYWSVGSVFATASKADTGAPIGLPGFHALAALAPAGMPVIGIGGITADNAGSLIQAGARGVAVISAIFAAADVQGAAKRIREAVDQALAGRKT
ncbi:MAG: thiamine phosphate synthase [Gemmatimonadetes bacterium]|nr:thiamine phosphate synthase [Gemmatimonadota bacterium]